MEIVVTVDGDPEGVRPLYEVMLASPELASARLLGAPAPAGALSGPMADAIGVLIHGSGAAGALTAVIVTWIRSQRGKIKVTASGPNGKIEVTAETGRGIKPESLPGLTAEILGLVEQPAVASGCAGQPGEAADE
jgi:Effector Associated Constant Component 1